MKKLSKKASTVSEALDTRLTCRAFTNKVPEKRVIIDLLEKAKRAPLRRESSTMENMGSLRKSSKRFH